MQLATRVFGHPNEQTILFIPGFTGSWRSWNEHFRALAAHYRLILIDTLGFGSSPRPQIEYSVADHVAAIHDTLQAHAAQHVHIVGHSMGCLLALAYASRYPAQVERLALLALPYFQDEAQARSSIRHASLFNRWLAMDTWLAKAACETMCALRPLLRPLAPFLVRGVPDVVARDALSHNWMSYSQTLRNVIFKADAVDWVERWQGPLLLVQGKQDTTAPLANVAGLALRPTVRLVVLDAAHGLIFTHSREIARLLGEFFAGTTR